MRLDPIADMLADAIGLDAASLGERGLLRAVDTAMSRAGLADMADYARLLAASPEALADLVQETVVPETWFFRDREPFRCLQERLQTLKARGKRPRILSAPCATGEEAYSIAITCRKAGLAPGGFYLAAVDISAEALAVARRGIYGRNSFRDDLTDAERHFIRQGDGKAAVMAVRPEIAATVDFVQDNIVGAGFLANEKPFDVIFSRNLLIYLNKQARSRLVANVGRLLAPDGMVFVGHAEVPSFLSAGFEAVPHPRAFACRRGVAAAPTAAALTPPKAASPTAPRAASPGLAAMPSSPARDVSDGLRPGPRPPAAASPGGENPLVAARRLADRGELAQAAALCRRRLETGPPSAEAYYLLGLVGAAGQRMEEAKSFFQKALYLDPGHAAALTHLALIHEQLGDASRASLCRQRLRRLSETERGGHERG
jgi:chemotaxis protein methyltransferase WspC